MLLVKLADRVHNMRTLHFIKNPDKRRRIAARDDGHLRAAGRADRHQRDRRTSSRIWPSPRSTRMPRSSIKARLDYLRSRGRRHGREHHRRAAAEARGGRGDRRDFWTDEDAVLDLAEDAAQGMSGSNSSPTSWRSGSWSTISAAATSVLGAMHGSYPVVPGRFKDYISTPKPNGYRSLHTGVIGPHRQRIEVQIRTRAMHDVAELGVAAHWNYKQREAINEGTAVSLDAENCSTFSSSASRPEEFPRAHQARDVSRTRSSASRRKAT
ncbi:MAG: hypothetical protein ACMVO3_15485 [Thalassobaculum sp.]